MVVSAATRHDVLLALCVVGAALVLVLAGLLVQFWHLSRIAASAQAIVMWCRREQRRDRP